MPTTSAFSKCPKCGRESFAYLQLHPLATDEDSYPDLNAGKNIYVGVCSAFGCGLRARFHLGPVAVLDPRVSMWPIVRHEFIPEGATDIYGIGA